MKTKKELEKIITRLISFSEGKDDFSLILKIENLLFDKKLDFLGISNTNRINILKKYKRRLNSLLTSKTTIVTATEYLEKNHEIKTILPKDQYIKYIKDQTIIGGMKIQKGWDILDYSIKERINRIKENADR